MELKNSMHNANKSIVQMCFLCPDVFGDVTADSFVTRLQQKLL